MARVARRSFLVGSLTSTALATSQAAQAESLVPRRTRPNVLWISADDLGCTLGCYGDSRVHSPRIDAFAKEAVLFERAYCQIAVCTSSRTSIMTGTRPETTGLWPLEHDWRATLPEHKSIAQHFSSHGYHTHSLGKIFDPRSGPGNAEGWVSMRHVWGIESADDALTQMEELAELPEDTPWFYAVGFKQPHCPWEPSKEAEELYPPDEMKLRGAGRRFRNEYLQKCSGKNQEMVDDAGAREVLSRYFGEVSDFDGEFGRLYDKASELGFLDNTIIICWSGDHGYQLSENGRWGKWTNYDASTRVPLIMSYPKMPERGVRVPGIVETVDMYATLSQLCGLPEPDHHEGLSFAALFHEPKRPWKKAAFSIWEDQSRSVKTDRHDLIVHDKPQPDPKERTAKVELFDLKSDPLEEQNIAEQSPQIVAEMKGLLEAGPENALPDSIPQVSGVIFEDGQAQESHPRPSAAPPKSGGCASCTVGRERMPGTLAGLSALGLLGALALRRRVSE